jgi:hypothetical protein
MVLCYSSLMSCRREWFISMKIYKFRNVRRIRVKQKDYDLSVKNDLKRVTNICCWFNYEKQLVLIFKSKRVQETLPRRLWEEKTHLIPLKLEILCRVLALCLLDNYFTGWNIALLLYCNATSTNSSLRLDSQNNVLTTSFIPLSLICYF